MAASVAHVTTKSPEVSVVTAMFQPNPEFLAEAHRSLCDQSPAWEWIIQCDEAHVPKGRIPSQIISDSRVEIAANGEHLGAAATRNLALMRCSTSFIQNLDADDVLYPDGMRLLLTALEEQPDAAIAFGQAILDFGDASLEHWQPAPWAPGLLAAGTIPDQWLATGRHHVSLASAMWRSIYLHAHGGWAAMKTMEDVSLLLAVTDLHAAVYIGHPIYKYRVHGAQTTSPTAHHIRRAQWNRAQSAARVLAARRLRGRESEWQYAVPDQSTPVDLSIPMGKVTDWMHDKVVRNNRGNAANDDVSYL